MATDIGRASAFLASGTIVSRVLGFAKVAVFGWVIGQQGQATDAFTVANQLPNTVYVIVAGGVLTAVLVPQIVRSALHDDGGAAYVNKLLTVALVILAGAAIAATLLAAPLTTLVGGSFRNPGQLDLAIAFAYWCMPQIFFYGLYTVLGEVLNARKSFGPFTWVPVLNNVVAIGGLILFAVLFGGDSGELAAVDYTGSMIAVLAGSATLGVVVQAVSLFYFWRRIGLRFRPDFRWRGVGLGMTGRLAGWTFGMLLLTTIAGIVETRVVSAASGSDASATMLSTAWLVFMLPHSVITVSIATAYFTRMAEHVNANRINELRVDVSAAIRGITVIITLAAAVIAVVAYPFSRIFILKGHFDQVQSLGNVIIAYVLGLVAFCILFVIQRAFYALSDTRTPFFFTLAQVVVVIVGVALCSLLPLQWIAFGVALVVTIAGIIQLAIAAVLLRGRLGGLDGRRIALSLAKDAAAVVAPLVAGITLLMLLGGTHEGGFAVSGIVPAILSMALIGAVMAVLYVCGLWLVRSAELRTVVEPLLARVRGR
ncbi:lipid II flippase MurJ [Rathayibacter sp. YIM 133350]|uniref:murein biosynthesis integral membrane protein MurJ n=1 Tax=Rathayibacter sp. YIM 133350 TaxID=3131992 RepID=UPI00307FC760